ncbi:hypothetical protein ON010_g74 [Phytophthora cinnamomi]|nr:hypothetical protein ON010_g74 [Phytophthora cinnamomi]
MVDVTTVGSDLTPAQQRETIADLVFFLDEFGSTRAVRAKLQEQERDIERLGKQVQGLLTVRRAKVEKVQREPENDTNDGEIAENIEVETEDADKTMVDLDFFLKTYKSTRAVREKLATQGQRIKNLHRTIQSLEKQRQRQNDRDDSRYVGYVGFDAAPKSVLSIEAKKTSEGEKRKAAKEVQNGVVKLPALDSKVPGDGGDDQARPAASCVGEKSVSSGVTSESRESQRLPSSDISNDSYICEKAKSQQMLTQGSSASTDQPRYANAEMNALNSKAVFTPRVKRRMCQYPYCFEWSQARGLCLAHGGYRGCKTSGCNQEAVARGHCSQHGNRKKCANDDCRKYSANGGQGFCAEHARQHGLVVKRGKTCSVDGCKTFARAHGHGRSYCCKHARENGIVVRTGKKCSVDDCGKFAVANGHGYCRRHARERGIVVRNDKKCAKGGCETFAVANGRGYCCRHARENGIVVRNGKKCSIGHCETFAVSGGQGYCCKHARENDIVMKKSKKCGTDGCEKVADSHGHGFCYRHARENGIIAQRTKKCSVEDCKSFAVFRGHCRGHASKQGIVIKGRCKFSGCQNLCKGQDYCEDNHSCEVKLAEDQRLQLDMREKTMSSLAPSEQAESASSLGQINSITKAIKRRGSHATCKVIGCMKWVKRDGDPSEYCVKHRHALTSQEPTATPTTASLLHAENVST